jgi:uncharacterized RDD family membrane protein YckC
MDTPLIYPKAHLGKRFAALLIDLIISAVAPWIGAFIISLFLYLIVLPIVAICTLLFARDNFEDITSWVVVGVIYFVILLTALVMRRKISNWWKKFKNPEVYIPFILLTVPLGYYLTKDGFNQGQSFGKKRMQLMVVDLTTNKPCTKSSSFLRMLVFLLLCIPYGLGLLFEPLYAMIQNEGRRLGDYAAKTQVIEASVYKN